MLGVGSPYHTIPYHSLYHTPNAQPRTRNRRSVPYHTILCTIPYHTLHHTIPFSAPYHTILFVRHPRQGFTRPTHAESTLRLASRPAAIPAAICLTLSLLLTFRLTDTQPSPHLPPHRRSAFSSPFASPTLRILLTFRLTRRRVEPRHVSDERGQVVVVRGHVQYERALARGVGGGRSKQRDRGDAPDAAGAVV